MHAAIRLSTLLVTGMMLTAAPIAVSAATTSHSGEVLVQALRSTGTEQRIVYLADLRLKSPGAQKEILRRVSLAVESLCAAGDMGVTDPITAFKCNRVAWDSVKPQLDGLLVR